ncbi:hypothetical protein EIQ31_16595 [Agrobacterium deltaense]|nr:hypothetical protein EIQ31_16595 [Agrobacterium deltaense]
MRTFANAPTVASDCPFGRPLWRLRLDMSFHKIFRSRGPAGAWGLPPSALPGISPSRGEIDLRQSLAHLELAGEAMKEPLADLPP